MSNDSDVYASAENYESLVEELKRRAGELGISCSDLDAIAGLPTGFAGKFMGPSQVKRLGPISLFVVLPALGLRLTLTVDREALHQYARRGSPRNRQQVRADNFSQTRVAERTLQRVLRHLSTFKWNDAVCVLADARRKVAAEAAKAKRKADAESKQPPARRQQNGNGAACNARRGSSAYDGPMVTATADLAELADAASIRVHRQGVRGRKIRRVSTSLSPEGPHTVIRRTQNAYRSRPGISARPGIARP